MYFCPNKDNAVFIYKTNKSGIKFLNKTFLNNLHVKTEEYGE